MAEFFINQRSAQTAAFAAASLRAPFTGEAFVTLVSQEAQGTDCAAGARRGAHTDSAGTG
jgi:hypothetical protein